MDEARFDRQIRLFGRAGQERIAAQRVAIVGLGGLGSHIAQSLAYLGVSSLTLIDHDRVSRSSLNRLIGATPDDAAARRLKVEVAERVIRAAAPEAAVSPIAENLRTRAALAALRNCGIIFGAVDNEGARLILTELASACEITLIDAASEILEARADAIPFGGRVVVARPGKLCLLCAGELSPEQAKIELEPPQTRVVRDNHGYGLGPEVPAPAVVSVNGVVSNIAVTEFVALVTGLREPIEYSHYKGHEGKVLPRDMANRSSECFTCRYLRGKGDAAALERYVVTESPTSRA
jgi:molybdopterin/thiamine biosynthesis adenylyltransferase